MKSMWRSGLNLLRRRHLLAQLGVMQDLRAYTRVGFLYAGLKSGLLKALKKSRTETELAQRLGVQRPELLAALLSVGVAIGELSVRGERYRVRGAHPGRWLTRRAIRWR